MSPSVSITILPGGRDNNQSLANYTLSCNAYELSVPKCAYLPPNRIDASKTGKTTEILNVLRGDGSAP